nr:hypothetical protein [Tanacetum cinerariifolium]
IAPEPIVSTGTPSSTTIDQYAPSLGTSQTTQKLQPLVIPLGVEEADHNIEVAHMDNNPYVDFPVSEPSFEESSTQLCLHPQSPIHLSTLIPSQGKSIGGADEELSDRGSPRVIMYGYDGLPMQPVPYVPMHEHLEYLVPSKDEAPIEDEPLPADASPTALSPGYVVDSDLDEDPEEDPKEDRALYPSDEGDGDDEPFDDDDDDDTDDEDEDPFEDEDDDEEEEEHLAPSDSSVVPTVDPVLSAGDTKAFETDESAPTL